MYENIARQIRDAENNKAKIGMFHLLVLQNAHLLAGVKAKTFVEAVGVPHSYITEFSKMMKVAKLMKERGVSFTQ